MLNPAELYRKSLIAFGKTVGNCRLCQLSMTRKLTTPGHNDRNNDEFQTERSEEVLTKRLDIAIVGHPNAGKSTLVNSLCGKNIMPVSSKVHTTRAVMHGYVTEDDTQLIFWDTPGLVTSKQARRHKLPKSIYDDPRHAFLQCDVIALMIDCVDHKHTNKIPQVVKEELASLFSTPSMLPDKEVVLLLNKIDLFKGTPKKLKSVVQVLTEGVVGGKSIESISTQSNPGKGLLASDFSSHLTDKFKRQLNIAESFKTESTEESISSDYVTADSISSSQENVSYSKPSLVDVLDRDDAEYFSQLSLLKQRRGFNGFSAVFQLSASQGYGVADLKTYFLQRAKPGRFEVKDGVYTNASLEKVVQNAIISRVFENLPHHLPYKVNIELQNIFETEHELVVVAVLVTPYQMGLVLGQNANTLRRIVAESKELISHIVEVPVKLSLTAEERFYVSRRN